MKGCFVLIEGVKVKKLIKHCDDRRFFMEILRDDDELLSRFGQASMSKVYPGVIKAFHYHEYQDDLWFFPAGNAQVVLCDLREGSPTKGETNVFYVGEDKPVLLLIFFTKHRRFLLLCIIKAESYYCAKNIKKGEH